MNTKSLRSQEWSSFVSKIRPGDIAAVIETGLVCRLSAKLILPTSPYLHHFLIADYIPDENDFVILESIPSHGVAVARLSDYIASDLGIFRPSRVNVLSTMAISPEQLGQKAVWQATKWGRARYDYRICIEIAWRAFSGCLRNWLKGKGFCVYYTEFPLSRDKALICTEVIDEAYYGLYPVFDRNYEVLPANFMSQYIDCYLDLICSWNKNR